MYCRLCVRATKVLVVPTAGAFPHREVEKGVNSAPHCLPGRDAAARQLILGVDHAAAETGLLCVAGAGRSFEYRRQTLGMGIERSAS